LRIAEVVLTLMSADGLLRVEVVRRPTGGYQLEYSRFHRENVPEYGLVWEGWVSVSGRVTLTDTAERGAALAAQELALC
jgi:hypothetical protein